ncbi:class I SAM-dependent methyltransferase [Acidaminobacter sp. JC074]|uniref:class I SAM-dependent methyltransferase n=1 Tax=Acidaminobacter sp. JC074 TaxID=2530199 RepID=UPI001F0D51CD|nr:class I SAM-dependent methyltransferase [Acidaminobacter sp. JC074]MCH4887110.1 class I SAM-dependent methyltransferase [Acidaminobacter sp. JC074]
MSDKASYDKAADSYDKGRPPYPSQINDWILKSTGMNTNHQLLEIAPGTGQATMAFARRGFSIKCVELSRNLADVLIEKVKDMNVSVDVSSFEKWQNTSERPYDFIYCATAFHWLDPEIKYKKCSDLLRDEGKLILIWNVFSESKNEIIKHAYDLLWELCPDKKHIDSEVLKENRKKAISASGEFQLKSYLDHKWQLLASREETINGFYSQSSFLSLDEKRQKDLKIKLDLLFDRLDAYISSDVSTTVYICEKVRKN